MKVSVITATTGGVRLADCIESVRNQTYKNIEHYVIVDGSDRWEQTSEILNAMEFPNGNNEFVIVLPHATGLNRFNGHRIYGGFSFLTNGDYIAWLDDDNEFTPNHIESLVKITQEKQLDWAYSLRQIVDSKGEFICNDDCENLGKYKSVLNDHFVDVSCFLVRRELAVNIAPIWHRQARPPNGVMEVDRALTAVLMHEQNKLKFDSNNDYTVKYRVGSTGISVQADFFINGNAEMLKRYAGKLPWKQ
jgi:glycosyltransferase involved in cell wall biosynthesis